MSTESLTIKIDGAVKEQAATVLSGLGLSLSDGVNVFLRKLVAKRELPFKVEESDETLEETRRKKFKEFLDFAMANPVFEKGYKFDREACYDRKVLR